MKALLLTLFLFTSLVFAEEKKYTQTEFEAQVQTEVEKQLDRIKKKSIAQLTAELLEKERAIKKKENILNKNEEQLKLAEETLAKKMLEFEAEQQKILGCVDINKQGEKKRINQLVSVISGMKPAKAAEILSVQDTDIAVKIIEKIDPQRASKIFNLMDKEISARLQKQYLNMQQ